MRIIDWWLIFVVGGIAGGLLYHAGVDLFEPEVQHDKPIELSGTPPEPLGSWADSVAKWRAMAIDCYTDATNRGMQECWLYAWGEDDRMAWIGFDGRIKLEGYTSLSNAVYEMALAKVYGSMRDKP